MEWPELLVSTGKAVYLCGPDGSMVPVVEGRGIYYGISWSNSNVYVLRRWGKRTEGSGEVVILDGQLEEVGILPGDFPDGHQIFYKDGKVYVTATSKNAIGVVDVDTGCVEFRNWTQFTYDVNHLNSIWHDDVDFWVGMHNYAEKEDSEFETSQVVRINNSFDSVSKSIAIGSGLHNVVVMDDVLYVCSSGDGKIVAYDLWTDTIVNELYIGEWLRGVSITRDFVVLGSSATLPKELRATGDSGLFLLDREFNVLDHRVITGCGPVYDLRVINLPDYAHNGISFPGRGL